MRELVRTNDVVVLSLVTARLTEGDVKSVIFDQNMSIMEGSIGVLAKRLMVIDDDYELARKILIEAGLEEWVKTK